MSLTAFAAHYQCHDKAGCSATKTKDGTTTVVVFRKGDLINTKSGWTIDPNDGWVKVLPNEGPGVAS
jgi:hypothetical protein